MSDDDAGLERAEKLLKLALGDTGLDGFDTDVYEPDGPITFRAPTIFERDAFLDRAAQHMRDDPFEASERLARLDESLSIPGFEVIENGEMVAYMGLVMDPAQAERLEMQWLDMHEEDDTPNPDALASFYGGLLVQGHAVNISKFEWGDRRPTEEMIEAAFLQEIDDPDYEPYKASVLRGLQADQRRNQMRAGVIDGGRIDGPTEPTGE